jgi:DNA-binding NtrC family response regulator
LAGEPGARPARIAGSFVRHSAESGEREMIETALAECRGKVADPKVAAAKLGIPRSTLDSKIKQLKINKNKYIAEQ